MVVHLEAKLAEVLSPVKTQWGAALKKLSRPTADTFYEDEIPDDGEYTFIPKIERMS